MARRMAGGGSNVGRRGENQGPEEGVGDELRWHQSACRTVLDSWGSSISAHRRLLSSRGVAWPQQSPTRALFC